MNDSAAESKHIDLILEGGGVKGIAFVGALRALEEQGYSFRRVAGTSAGAIAAALLAAGYTARELEEIISGIDYPQFADESFIDHFGLLGKSLSVLFEKGIYEGKATRQFVYDLLAAKGIVTFGDLRLQGEAANGQQANYRLVVIATDVTTGKLIRLPWDYEQYGLNPDEQIVADAVRASAAIPFYYEPVRLGRNYLVDGGIVSNFPIWLFEGGRHTHCRDWPTFGIKLSAKPEALLPLKQNDTSNTFSYFFSILRTILSAQDQIHLDDLCTVRRTIFVDSEDIKATDFGLSEEAQKSLHQNGYHAAQKFLKAWDFQDFLRACPEKQTE